MSRPHPEVPYFPDDLPDMPDFLDRRINPLGQPRGRARSMKANRPPPMRMSKKSRKLLTKRREHRARELAIDAAESKIRTVLNQGGAYSARALADATGVEIATISAALKSLRKKRLVAKASPKTWRRA